MRLAAIIATLVVATLATYWSVLSHDWITIDDPVMVAKNPDLNPPTAEGLARYWRASARELYMPLTYTAWAAVAAAPNDGDTLPPGRFHAFSLTLHVLSVLVVFALLRELVKNDFAAAGGAFLFALHPLQVESVAWIALTKDLLAGLFTLAAIWQYVLFVRKTPDPDHRADAAGHYALATLAFVLGMLAKPSAVIAPLVAIAIDAGLFRRPIRDVVKSAGPWLVLAVPFVLIARSAQQGSFEPVMGSERTLPLWWRPIVAGDAIAFYLGKLVWPAKLAVDYGRSPWDVMGRAWVWASVAIPLVLAVALWAVRRRFDGLLVAFAVMVAALLPVLGLVPFDFQEKSTVTDHYMYLAMLGPALAAAWILASWPGRTSYTIALLVLAIFAIRSRAQTTHWRDSETCYRHTLATNAKSWWLADGLGWLLLEQSRPIEAIAYLKQAVAAAPNYAAAHAHLGAAYAELANVTAAVEHLEKSLAIDPNQPRIHIMLGDIQTLRGLRDRAASHYEAATKLDPTDRIAAERLKMTPQTE